LGVEEWLAFGRQWGGSREIAVSRSEAGTSPESWLGMQVTCDLERTRDEIGAEIEAKIRPRAA